MARPVPTVPPRLRELTRAVRLFTESRGLAPLYATGIPGFTILRADQPRGPAHRILKPALCVTLQGAKWADFGSRRLRYPAGEALVVSVETPSRGTVEAASPNEPFLGIICELDAAVLQSVIQELELAAPTRDDHPAATVYVTHVTESIADCLLRAVRLTDTPAAVPLLYPGILRELSYWLLTAPDSSVLIGTILAAGRGQRLLQAIHYLRDRFDQPVSVEELASLAGMSLATFHRQFKALTSMAPLQYQKEMRLLEARRRMLADSANAETAAFAVGYESASQFSREYSRMFGRSPRRDIDALRSTAA